MGPRRPGGFFFQARHMTRPVDPVDDVDELQDMLHVDAVLVPIDVQRLSAPRGQEARSTRMS